MKHIWQINFVRRMVLVLTLALSAAEVSGAMDDYVDDLIGDELGEGRTRNDFGADLYLLLSDMPVRYFSKRTIDGAYYQFKLGFPYSESVEPPDRIPGYRFTKWRAVWYEYDDDAPVYLYALWEKDFDFVVHFNANDGMPSDPYSQRRIYPATGEMLDQEFSYGVAQNLNKCAFTRAGYTFSGWSKYSNSSVLHKDGASIKLSKSDTSFDTYELYAIWNPKTITYTFDFQGWDGRTSESKTCKVGQKYQGWIYVDSTDCNIDGWYKKTGEKVESGDYVPTENTTLYLHWQRKEYTIKFDPNGGEGKMASKKFQYGIATALPANQFVCSGCRFKGWATTSVGSVEFTDGQQVKKIKDMAALSSLTVKLYAVWEPVARPVKVVFDPMGGTADYTEWTYEIGKHYGRLPNVTYNGYTFKGWRTQPNGGSVVNVNTSAAANVTKLYAWCVPVSYAIDYCETKGAANPNPTSYDIEDEIVFSPLPNVTGYTFVRWEPSMIARGSTGYRTVTAIWKTATYSIVYKPGRLGRGDEVRVSKTHGESLTLKGALYTREGYRQIGWTTHEEGQGEYKLKGTCDVNANLTLYPAWEPLPTYTITYEPGYYGSGEPVVERYYVGDSATLRGALFTREGCVQTGWTTVDGEFKTHSFGETYSEDRDLTLYATWIAPQVEDYQYKVVGGEAWITGYKGSEVEILIPSKIGGYPVVGIDSYAFYYYGCKLVSVIIPGGVREIGAYAFGNIDTLVRIDLPHSVESIGEYAFFDCDALVSVAVPSCTSVGNYVFDGCDRLQTVVFTPGIKQVGSYMFSRCRSLEDVVIPSSVGEIGSGAFLRCDNLSRVVIESGVRKIGTDAFSGCSALRTLVFPESVAIIGLAACQSCDNLEKVIFLCGQPTLAQRTSSSSLYASSLYAPSDCAYYALSEKPGWGVLPTTWDGHTVKGHQLSFPCAIMFDPNGGTGGMDDLVCESGEKVYKLPPCTFTPPAGKRFAGWRSMLGKRYDDGMLVFGLRSLGGIVMMTAIWE